MKKLRNVLAAALLTIPLATVSASSLTEVSSGREMRPTQMDYCCMVYFAGRYYCLPC